MKKILVTGGAGFIGSHCVDELLSQSWEVVVLDIKTVAEAVNLTHCLQNITYIEGDIREKDDVNKALVGCTHVLHLAAIVSVPLSIEQPVETHATNVTGMLNVLEGAKSAGISRVVYASSAAVYSPEADLPVREDASCQPSSPYGMHKLMNEQYAHLYQTVYGLSSVGLRFFNVYGSRQDPSSPYSGVISIFKKCAVEGRIPTIYGDGSATRDFVYVEDVARLCVTSLDSESMKDSVYNIGTGVAVSINKLWETMQAIYGVEQPASYQNVRAGDLPHSCASTERLQTQLKKVPDITLRSGLEAMRKKTNKDA